MEACRWIVTLFYESFLNIISFQFETKMKKQFKSGCCKRTDVPIKDNVCMKANLLFQFLMSLSLGCFAQQRASWVGKPAVEWPKIALINEVQFKKGICEIKR